MARLIPHYRVRNIIWHCSATRPTQDIGAEDIRRWHQGRGWADIGYHFVIRIDGSIELGRPMSIDGFTSGAHTRGRNSRSIGVCVIGGLDEDGRSWTDGKWITVKQGDAMRTVHRFLSFVYPAARHVPHNAFAAKDCPCFDVDEFFA